MRLEIEKLLLRR